ncbi:hypothetical protein [Streptomyces sp. NPDC091299]|uniref:hypothetical protein n=1 Tax=Streptomyces sp. NPDC091299 TaxID=3155302 RepID=UPI00341C5801
MTSQQNPAPGAVENNAGHESGQTWSAMSLKGGCAEGAFTQPVEGVNTGAQRPGPNAMWTESPNSGFMGGVMHNYSSPVA